MSKFNPAEATAYLQIKLTKKLRYCASEAKVVKVTQRKPEQVEPGCIVAKIKIRIPVEGWDPFEPEAVIDVPADLVQHPIEIEVEDTDA